MFLKSAPELTRQSVSMFQAAFSFELEHRDGR